MTPHLTYRDVRPVVLPPDLSALSSELDGVVRLPGRLDWSAKKEYDLASEQDLRSLYVRVIQEASTPADFAEYLNQSTLRSIWSTLNVGRHLASAWEERFPELRQAAR